MTPTVSPSRRRQRGEGGLYQRSDGLWVGVVDLGWAGGKRRRKTVTSKDYTTAFRKLRDLRKQVHEHGDLPTAGMTVEKWLTYWLDHIAAKRIRPRTLTTYRGYVANYLTPALGRKRLDQLQPQHVRAMHQAITNNGQRSTTTALQAHRILVKALTDAQREGHVTRNVATLVDAPRKAAGSRGALSPEEAVTLLRSVDKTAIGARWAAALFLGARQGECLGLEWDRVDLDAGTVDLAWQLQRLAYRHGCGHPTGKTWPCGRKRGGNCPQRVLDVPDGFECRPIEGGLVLTRPKSRSGLRVIPLPQPMWQALAWHRQQSTGQGLVWTRADGRPIDPKVDSADWHAALEAAGLPPVPLHVARHTTGTLLLRLGVDTSVVMSILGHSSAATTRGYQHSDLTLQRDAMNRLGGLLALD